MSPATLGPVPSRPLYDYCAYASPAGNVTTGWCSTRDKLSLGAKCPCSVVPNTLSSRLTLRSYYSTSVRAGVGWSGKTTFRRNLHQNASWAFKRSLSALFIYKGRGKPSSAGIHRETMPRSFLDVTNSQFRVKQKKMLIIAVLSVISTVSASGGWSLRAPSCPTSLKSCAEGTSSCCPADLDCISVGGRVVCCPPGMQVLSPFSLMLC